MSTDLDDPSVWKEFNDEMDDMEKHNVPRHVLEDEINNILEITDCFFDGGKTRACLEALKRKVYKRMGWPL